MKPVFREHWPIYSVALGAVLLILVRIVSLKVHERFDNTALILFSVAGAALVLPFIIREIPRIKRLKHGDTEIEFRDLERDLPSIGPSKKVGVASEEAEIREQEEAEALDEVEEIDEVEEVVERPDSASSLVLLKDEDEDEDEGVQDSELVTAEDWRNYRQASKRRSRNVFLAHVIKPSVKAGQTYDIFIFLVRPKSFSLDDVEHAEFFFGRFWGNRVFTVPNEGGKIGISTSAYGPFLAACRVTFKDGYWVTLERFIDFEMGRVFEEAAS